MSKDFFPYVDDVFHPALTSEQIEMLQLTSNQVHNFEMYPGSVTHQLFEDFILDGINIERRRSLDIDAHLLALALRKELAKGKEVECDGLNFNLSIKVGDEVWDITL